ncbi:MAG TPA: hypothetical protein VGN42_26370 [Pirellulales bacterium]|jgi:hypothetical protein|nr:hypothetical protein [Pirellulales bacterium]
MKSNVSPWRFGFRRATTRLIYAAVAAAFVLSSTGCGANGKLFGRKEAEPPKTVKEFLMLPRPE